MKDFRVKFRQIAVQFALILTTLVVVDVLAYWLLPSSIAAQLPQYRRHEPVKAEFLLADGYPRDYFVANPERGFDIGPGRKGLHYIYDEDITLPIWSNALGCFDREWETVPGRYVYVAGDSFAWGYAPFESKLATRLEALTGMAILKCAVTNTGQAHQFSKFREIMGKIGRFPEKVIVAYCWNDVSNDFIHPHTTVIDGWSIDKVYLGKDFKPYVSDDASLRKRVSEQMAAMTERARNENAASVKNLLKRYSLSAQLADRVVDSMRAWDDEPKKGKDRFGLGALMLEQTHDGYYAYESFPYAERNKANILAWRDHARANGYELDFALIPPKEHAADTAYYRELRAFLERSGIRFIDLTEAFRARGEDTAAYYWPVDPHLSPLGNAVVAEILRERMMSGEPASPADPQM